MSRESTEKQIQARENERKALELRLAGHGYAHIAAELACSLSTAHTLVKRALNRIPEPQAAELKRLELERLDALQAGLWKAAASGAYLSVDRVLAIMQRRAALLGLDAPQRIDVTAYLRQRAVEEGLDPNAVVAEAERLIKAGAVR